MHRCYWCGLWFGIILTIWGSVPGVDLTQAIQVAATVETEPVPNKGDADDELGCLYIGEENVGIWKYAAEPDEGIERVLVDSTDSSGHLTKDVDGPTIYKLVPWQAIAEAGSPPLKVDTSWDPRKFQHE